MIRSAIQAVRSHRALLPLGAAVTVFFIAIAVVFLLAMREHRALAAGSTEDALWASYQLNRETLRLDAALENYAHKPDQSALDGIALRMDILYSRAALIRNSKFPLIFGSDSDFAAMVENSVQGIDALDSVIQALFAAGGGRGPLLDEARAKSDRLLSLTEKLLQNSKALAARDRADKRDRLQMLYATLAVLVGASSMTMVGIMIMLLRQYWEAVRSRRQMESLTSELIETAERAEAANRAKSAFLATMSHEIRTPLNGVIGSLDVMLDLDMDPDLRVLANVARSCGVSLLELINDILDFSKLEAGGVELEAIPFDPVATADEAARMVEHRAAEKGLLILVAPTLPPGVLVKGDPARVRQVMANLLSNAVKFTDKGFVRLTCSLDGALGRLRVEVTDTGIGIPPEKSQNLFKEFIQLDASITRRFGGTGLGLAICRRIVTALGGTIGVNSTEAYGSTFWFELPVEAVDAPAAAPIQPVSVALEAVCPSLEANVADIVAHAGWTVVAPEAADVRISLTRGEGGPELRITARGGAERRLSCLSPLSRLVEPAAAGPAPSQAGGHLSTLIAEDNQVNREILRRLLTGMGYAVEMVENGAEALEAVAAGSYDVVFMDVMMPEMDGLEATRRIRALPGPAGATRIVGVTANAFASDREACLAAGMDGFVTKPVAKTALVAAIEALDLVAAADRPDAAAGEADAPAALPAPAPAAAAPAPDAAAAVVDDGRLAELRDELGEDGLDFVLACFIEETAGLVADLATALEAGDEPLVRRIIHTIKGSGSNIGFTDLAAQADRIRASGEVTAVDHARLLALAAAAMDTARSLRQDAGTPVGLVA